MKNTALYSARKQNIYIITFLTVGVCLRLFHFINNRSLWEDEFYLSSSFLHMDLSQLATQQLDYQQRAPLGYLFAEYFSVSLFGVKEMGLRFFPFLCGIASLLAFVPVAKHFLKQVGATVAIAIMCLSPTFVYHGVEAKQYGTEVLATILSLLLFVQFYNERRLRWLVLWGCGGAVIIWFSFTSVFVLAGIGAAVCLQALQSKDFRRLSFLLLPVALWIFSFGLNYLFFVSRYPEAKWLFYYWQNRDAFLPMNGKLVVWLAKQTYSIVHNPLGITWLDLDYHYKTEQRFLARAPYLGIVCWIMGVFSFARRDRQLFYVLSFPILFTLVASALKLYPLQERLILFLSPILLLFIGEGCTLLMGLMKARFAVKLLVPVLLVAPALLQSSWQVMDTDKFGEYKKSHQREALLYVNEHCGKDDITYIYWNELPAYRYYKQVYSLHFPAVEGADYRNVSYSFPDYYNHLQRDFNLFAGKKYVWLIYKNYNGIKIGDFENHPLWYYGVGVNAVGNLEQHFQGLGRKLSEYYPAGKDHYNDVEVIQYELGKI